MRHALSPILAPVLMALGLAPACAAPLDDLRWEKRPILVFAASEDDPRLAEQLALFEAERPGLEERRNVVIVDTDAGSALRDRFRPEGFTVILVGLDGGEKYRTGAVVEPATLNRLIDAMPMRERELMRTQGAEDR